MKEAICINQKLYTVHDIQCSKCNCQNVTSVNQICYFHNIKSDNCKEQRSPETYEVTVIGKNGSPGTDRNGELCCTVQVNYNFSLAVVKSPSKKVSERKQFTENGVRGDRSKSRGRDDHQVASTRRHRPKEDVTQNRVPNTTISKENLYSLWQPIERAHNEHTSFQMLLSTRRSFDTEGVPHHTKTTNSIESSSPLNMDISLLVISLALLTCVVLTSMAALIIWKRKSSTRRRTKIVEPCINKNICLSKGFAVDCQATAHPINSREEASFENLTMTSGQFPDETCAADVDVEMETTCRQNSVYDGTAQERKTSESDLYYGPCDEGIYHSLRGNRIVNQSYNVDEEYHLLNTANSVYSGLSQHHDW